MRQTNIFRINLILWKLVSALLKPKLDEVYAAHLSMLALQSMSSGTLRSDESAEGPLTDVHLLLTEHQAVFISILINELTVDQKPSSIRIFSLNLP